MGRTIRRATLRAEGRTLGRTITPPEGGEPGRRRPAGSWEEGGGGVKRRLPSPCAGAETPPLVLKW